MTRICVGNQLFSPSDENFSYQLQNSAWSILINVTVSVIRMRRAKVDRNEIGRVFLVENLALNLLIDSPSS